MQRALLFLFVAASYLLQAGTPRWSRLPLLAIAIATIAAAPGRVWRARVGCHSLDTCLVVLMAAMLLQAVPLPPVVISVVSPSQQQLRASSELMVAAPSAWRPLSIDPPATLYALTTMLLGVMAFWTTRGAFASGGVRQYLRLLGLGGAVLALIALAQRVTSPGLVMGMIRPSAPNANPFGPFLNRNHFAAWMLMVSAATAGYLIAHLHIHPAYRGRFALAVRHFLASGALLLSTAVMTTVSALLVTLSRSAGIGLAAAAVCAGVLGQPRLTIERTRLPGILTSIGVMALIAVTFVDISGWLARLQDSFGFADAGYSRLTIWRESLPIIRDFIATGTGAGTYDVAMLGYQQTRIWVGAMVGWVSFNNAHSHYVQLAAEGGLLLVVPAATAIALFVAAARKAIRGDKGEMFWIRIGAAAGLTGVATQSIWEVALIIPANAVLCGVLAGLVVHRRDVAAESTPRPPRGN